MLRAVDDAAAALAQGYQAARRDLVREQESARREFIDDLLSGRADVVGLLERAAGFGLDLSGSYAVAVVHAQQPFIERAPLVGASSGPSRRTLTPPTVARAGVRGRWWPTKILGWSSSSAPLAMLSLAVIIAALAVAITTSLRSTGTVNAKSAANSEVPIAVARTLAATLRQPPWPARPVTINGRNAPGHDHLTDDPLPQRTSRRTGSAVPDVPRRLRRLRTGPACSGRPRGQRIRGRQPRHRRCFYTPIPTAIRERSGQIDPA